ncbi:DUF2087 domain-containing protein [Antiquaquibacter soli]|uniref:DUF2087 domain-containing protein n=1 Tax=Antiquaquibacter soli TaxID=3064523 RepID=A0ABT9BPP7_9MICO|nr:DUF2087 domain-containing protein [Protaetiibacter sp. WY-16]MDO7882996.1 DUF2087 domain-containing protein [Protaetiibacter sp. WY-16]
MTRMNQWRRLAAALADPHRAETWARALLGQEQPDDKRTRKALDELAAAGLVDADGRATDAFARLLAENPAVTREGVDRWLRDGRIDSFPARPKDRLELLRWVAARLPERELTEAEVGEHLSLVTGDVATLRRYLVDAGLLHRAADGSGYRRA